MEGLEPENDLGDKRQNYNSENHGIGFGREMTDREHYQDAFPMDGPLSEVVVSNNYTVGYDVHGRIDKDVDEWEGTYFDKDNYGRGQNPYSPYIPDGSGISANVNVNTGLFGKFSFVFGFARNSAGVTKAFWGYNGNFGYNGTVGIPKISAGLSVDFYDNFGENKDIFAGIQGYSHGGFGSLGVGGSFTESALETTDGLIKASEGVYTTSFGLGFGFNGGYTQSYTNVIK